MAYQQVASNLYRTPGHGTPDRGIHVGLAEGSECTMFTLAPSTLVRDHDPDPGYYQIDQGDGNLAPLLVIIATLTILPLGHGLVEPTCWADHKARQVVQLLGG